jgi:hypothetical protein
MGVAELTLCASPLDFHVEFELIGPLYDIETIAVGSSIRALPWLRKKYGDGRGRKLKAIAKVRAQSGRTRTAELH